MQRGWNLQCLEASKFAKKSALIKGHFFLSRSTKAAHLALEFVHVCVSGGRSPLLASRDISTVPSEQFGGGQNCSKGAAKRPSESVSARSETLCGCWSALCTVQVCIFLCAFLCAFLRVFLCLCAVEARDQI